MTIDPATIETVIAQQAAAQPFSGAILIRQDGATVLAEGYGFANRADEVPNTIDTRFGIASGTKTFTAAAICRLVEEGRLSFDTRLVDCLDIPFPHFDPAITVHHLLTHSAGNPDYFDEETMPDEEFERLWLKYPVYTIRSPRDLLPMFQHLPMKFAPGARFGYSNAGYVLLGLIIEQVTGGSFADAIQAQVFARCGMAGSGFFHTDRLPARTASAYIQDPDGSWRTNIFSVPAAGMPDGGAYTTAPDMARFWDALWNHHLLSPETTARLCQPHVRVSADDDRYYGYGVWLLKPEETVTRVYALGGDPGVAFISAVFPLAQVEITCLANTDGALWSLFPALVEALGV